MFATSSRSVVSGLERMNQRTLQHLASVDPILGAVIERVGPCGLKPHPERSPFQALVQAVAHQQLNGKAAKTILTRFLALFPHGRFPSPEEVQALDPGRLVGVGFSRAKASYIQGIARGALEGVVPSRSHAQRLADDTIVERFTQIKG